MPQAVSSNSIAVSRYQQARHQVQNIFNDATLMINAFGNMASLVADSKDHDSVIADGFFLIHQLLMRELDDAVKEATDLAGKLAVGFEGDHSRRIQLPIDPDLFGRVGAMVEEQIGAENDGPFITKTAEYYNELLERLAGETDLIEAASLLPWLELKIRNELTAGDSGSTGASDELPNEVRAKIERAVEQIDGGGQELDATESRGVAR